MQHEALPERRTPTYHAALLGLNDVLASILSRSSTDINAEGGKYGNALQAASQGGHKAVVQLLLGRSAKNTADR